MSDPRWIGVALSFYAFIAIGMVEGGLGVLIPSIQVTYHLTPATVTLLFLSQLSGYIVAAIASSLLSSRLGLARMLLLAAALLTSALIIYAFSSSWSVMVAAGILLGLGIGLIDAGINTYIASDQAHADLTGILHAFYGIGALLGPALATTLLAINLDWRQIYQVFATVVAGVIIGMGWAVLYRYAPMRRQHTHSTASAGLNLRVALRTPIVIMAGLLLMIYVGMESAVGNWAYSVQAVGRGTPTMLAGYSVSAYWFGLTLGRLVMGRLVRRLGANRLLDWFLGLLAIALLIWWQLPNAWFVLPVIGFALGPIFPTTIWLMPQRVATALVPAAIGFITSVASLGAATIPTSMGWLAARSSLEIIPALLLPLVGLLVMLHRWLVQRASTVSGL